MRLFLVPVVGVCFSMLAPLALGQAPPDSEERDTAVGDSVNYVFATDLGSGVYDFNGRTLQIYRYSYLRELREVRDDQWGARFTLPVTVGFFDFSPADVIAEGPPSRIDSLSLVPGIEFDHVMENDWHFIPYVRAGASLASSSVNGWLYGAGVRFEKSARYRAWEGRLQTKLSYAGVRYRDANVPNDSFVRARYGADLTRTARWRLRGREMEYGLYAIFDFILDPPTAPLAQVGEEPLQAEFGFTLSSQPRFKIWRFDAPRLGFGYRVAGDLSAWRFVIGAPF